MPRLRDIRARAAAAEGAGVRQQAPPGRPAAGQPEDGGEVDRRRSAGSGN